MSETVLRSEVIEDIGNMLNNIVEKLPTSFILQQDILESIVEKITKSYAEIIKDELIDAVLSIATNNEEAIEAILQQILAAVFGTGIDYLYYIKDI